MKTLEALLVLSVTVLASFAAEKRKEPLPDLGVNTSFHGKTNFPPDDPWNQDISKEPVDPNSDVLVASIGKGKSLHPDFGRTIEGVPWGIPYVVVDGKQPKVPVNYEYPDESDKGPYPIPADAPIEGGPKSTGDRHVLVIDRNWTLYETFSSFPIDGGKSWKAGSGAIFDLTEKHTEARHLDQRPTQPASLLAGLVRYDEAVEQKEITHAIRFTVTKSRRAYVAPGRHWASNKDDPKLPPMGMRVRLKGDYDISKFTGSAKVIATALQKYGMIVADNGGDWFITGAPDPRWNDEEIDTLKRIKGKDFEVVKMPEVITPKTRNPK